MSFVFLEHTLGHGSTLLLYPLFLWVAAALAVKRLHDRGTSGWRLLLVLIPILGPAWLVVRWAFWPAPAATTSTARIRSRRTSIT